METFSLEGHPFITLNNLLKVLGWADSGAHAKDAVASGEVTVDGEVELRKRCKITAGQVVAYAGQQVTVTG